ncbi:MAG: histidine--tRNA ligase [Sumerlaeia bacterium]
MAKPSPLQAVKGMHDILPVGAKAFIDRAEHWLALRRAYSEWAEVHGYGYIETPALEPTELFKRTAGETSDVVSKEMYTFQRADDGPSLSLRPEGSASVCRAVLQHGLAQAASQAKLYYICPMFRAESPQKGRYRQHTQFGAELFKESDPTADAEVIAMLYGFYQRLGLSGIEVHLNSVGTDVCRPAYRDKLVAYLMQHEASLSADSKTRLSLNPMRVLDSKAPEDQDIADNAPVMIDHLDPESAEHFEGLKAALTALDIPYRINTRLVRGLDYYTRTAFEMICPTLDGAIKVIGGGGRYDGLVEQIGGPHTPAVGFGCGVERLLLALESQNITPGEEPKPTAFVCYFGDEDKMTAFQVLQNLRSAGVRAEFSYQTRKLNKQLKAANNSGARFAVLVGGDEGQRGEAVLKDLVAKDERPVALGALASAILSAPAANAPML